MTGTTGMPAGDRQAREALDIEDAAAVIAVLTALRRSAVRPIDDPAPQSFWAGTGGGSWSAGPGQFWASGLPR